MYFVLCVSMSSLLFTWTFTTTVVDDPNMMVHQILSTPQHLRNPFGRITGSRSLAVASTLPAMPSSSRPIPAASVPIEKALLRKDSIVENTITPTSITDAVPKHLRIRDDQPIVQIINTR